MKEKFSSKKLDEREGLGEQRGQERLTAFFKLLEIDADDQELKGRHKLLYYLSSFIVSEANPVRISLAELEAVSGLKAKTIKAHLTLLNNAYFLYAAEEKDTWILQVEYDPATIDYQYDTQISYTNQTNSPGNNGARRTTPKTGSNNSY